MSSRWKERNAKTRKDRKCVGENPYQSEEGALAWDRQLHLASGSGPGEVCGSHKKMIWGEGRAERGMRFLRAHGSAELGQVAPGSAVHGLWLGSRKVRSLVVGKIEANSLGK